MAIIDSIAALEATVGKPPPAIGLKVIDHVDATAQRWLASSPLMFAGVGNAPDIAITLVGGARGFACSDGVTLAIPLDHFDAPHLLQAGAGFGSLFLLPGIGETLRINGTVASIDGMARIAVSECYVHCAKALIRSDFWKAEPTDERPGDAAAFAAAKPADGAGDDRSRRPRRRQPQGRPCRAGWQQATATR
ncbi:hypothetical protein [Sphingopyxis sp. PET50]|uniref:hypothetical protein n=1 Tax=Sphingopyxis sp. PET50 TaxID=2976533 RepID=UPI0021AEA126|nr:hypothetical protein [Sphingopyxis sp. PET50]